jgi:hypothetical protein
MRTFTDLKLRSHRCPLTSEQIEGYVGTDCRILNVPYVIVAAVPTDDPYVAAIELEPKRVWRF